ncbi:hypothetical protein HDU93_002931 [Gonapodya sp. JEL0774]|nr:hypothetical protein HDU93_002931 [Gonapodya sp. JEL0774]
MHRRNRGSGKTTQVPQYLLEAFGKDGSMRVAVTQPRRIAATSAAQRVSQELGQSRVGLRVGYKIRFETAVGNDTQIVYMTDGVLLREACTDPALSAYQAIVIDEAHERSLDTDVLLGLLKRARKTRPELKLFVMSATLDVEKFSTFLDDAPCFSVPGRTFQVDTFFQKKMKLATLKSTFVQRAVDTAMHIHATRPAGHILVFLTGQDDIETAVRRAEEAHGELNYPHDVSDKSIRGLKCLPVYSALESGEQRAIFEEPREGIRKVVFATNIAQTSITIPGIRYVVDSGFVKQKQYDAATGMDALLAVPISQSAATQRAGRAGRTTHGECYRLYSREAFEEMEPETVPEIQRSSLLAVVLDLKKMGIKDILGFEFIDPPEKDLELAAIRQLFLLDALDPSGDLTPIGDLCAAFPVSPFLARMLIAAARDYSCSREAIIIAAMLSVESIWVEPRGEHKRAKADQTRRAFAHPSGDHLTLLRVWDAWSDSGYDREWCFGTYVHHRAMKTAQNVREQIKQIMQRLGLDTDKSCSSRRVDKDKVKSGSKKRGWAAPDGEYDPTPVLKALCAAFYPNAAKRHVDRPYYYSYAASSGLSKVSRVDSNSGMLAMYVHAQSALHEEPGSGDSGIEWVVYNDVVFTNKATMRQVSQVDYSWIEHLLPKLGQIDDEKLTGRTAVELGISVVPASESRMETSHQKQSSGTGAQGAIAGADDSEAAEERKRKLEEEREEKLREVKERYMARKKART